MLICPVIMILYINFFGDSDLQMSKFDQPFLTYTDIGGHIVMMSWGFPSIHEHVEVPFSSVSQVLFIFGGIQTTIFSERCLRNHYFKFGGELTPPKAEKQ